MGLRFRMAPEIGWKVGIVPAGLRETTARPTNKLGQVGPFGMLNGPQAKQQEYAQRISGLYFITRNWACFCSAKIRVLFLNGFYSSTIARRICSPMRLRPGSVSWIVDPRKTTLCAIRDSAPFDRSKPLSHSRPPHQLNEPSVES
jgi:hypothetical protein